MEIFYKFGRFWAALCPVALLVLAFKYAHQLNSILMQIDGMSFKKTLTIMFVAFLAAWSLLYVGSVLFIRVMRWIWKGTTLTQTEKSSIHIDKEIENPAKNNIEYHNVKEQENLFRLDLQDEPAETVKEEGQQENKVL